MRIPTRAALLLALAAGACSGSRTTISAGVTAPSAVVAFQGITSRYPVDPQTGQLPIRPYVAVASGRGGELRIIDATEDRPILGPTLVFPLSIPTDARPLKLAAASLGDGGADLLAVALPGSAGAPAIEIVETWTAENRIASAITLLGLGSDTEIVSLTAGPVTGATGPVAGKARLVAGLATSAGFQLAVVDVARDAGGSGAVVPAGPAALQPLAFPPLDLAFSPTGELLFVATTEPIAGEIRGVAQLAVGDPATTWPVTALDARAGTTHVAAAVVAERAVTETTDGVVSPATSEKVFGAPELRVYAALDPERCGDTMPIRCGIATLVPGVGLAPDPTRVVGSTITTGADPTAGMPYRAPIEYFGVTAALAMAPALAHDLPSSPCNPASSSGLNPGGSARTLLAPPGSGQRCTTASGVVASSDGNTYVMDLGRFEIPSETSVIVDPSQRTRVTSATSTIPLGTTGAGLGLADSNGQPISSSANLAAAVQVTPGFTPSETFRVTYQGVIPGLRAVFGVVRRLPTGELVLTGQADSGSRNSAGEVNWIEGPKLSSALFSVQAGDIAQLETVQVGVCEGDVASARVDFEVAVVDVVQPGATILGGALKLDEAALPCFAAATALPGKFVPVKFNVRASGLILTGDALGYLGRPPSNGEHYTLEYHEANAKPLADPDDRAPEPVNEAQLLARKARRRFYPGGYACPASGCSGYPGFTHALASGPMLAFTATAPGTQPRDAQLVIVTASGYLAFTSRPTGAEAPVGAAPIDRTTIDPNGNLAVRWYVGYSDDQVFVFGPAEAPNQAFSIR